VEQKTWSFLRKLRPSREMIDIEIQSIEMQEVVLLQTVSIETRWSLVSLWMFPDLQKYCELL
jgi:hypothetical protein